MSSSTGTRPAFGRGVWTRTACLTLALLLAAPLGAAAAKKKKGTAGR